MTGRFISLEGGDGVGKSTQVKMLAALLGRLGIPVTTTREPGGSPGAETIRGLILSKSSDWDMRTEALLFAAARADHVDKIIGPALARGEWVVSDRFVDSSRAYQGGAGGLGDDHVMDLHRLGAAIMPERTVLLRMPQVEGTARANGDGDGDDIDRILARGAPFHSRVETAFDTTAAGEPHRVRVIDASGTVEQVHARVAEALKDLLPKVDGDD